jgi:glycosyltransferase involved in cell wall biosynthesis
MLLMKQWLPKEQRKKIMLLSDDMRVHSGIGVMSREIIEQTSGVFNWVQVGAAINHPEAGKIVDISADVSRLTGIEDASVRIYPQNGYGDSRVIRQLLDTEKPDAILHFTDPRYWIWLYQIEHEIRQKIPMMFYTIWDDLPYPKYNKNFYRSDDGLFCISKQTYNIVKQVLGPDEAKDKVIAYLPHGIDTKKFYPIQQDDTTGQEFLNTVRKETLRDEPVDFVVFYNARNLRRKMTSDVLLAFNHFIKKLPKDKADRCRLVMHTAPIDENGTDLPVVIRDVTPDIKVVFSNSRVDASVLNALYNMADVTINLASNEGFGLGTAESMVTGTPIIVNVTGGLQDQCGFMTDDGEYLDPEKHFNYEWGSNHDGRYKKHGEWAFPCFPTSRSLQGSPLTPYIFDDRCSWEDAGEHLFNLYNMTPEERKRRGMLGREYALGHGMFTAEKMGELFIEHINKTLEHFTPRERYVMAKV